MSDKATRNDKEQYVYEVLSSIANDSLNRFTLFLESEGLLPPELLNRKSVQDLKWKAIDDTIATWDLGDFMLTSYELRRKE
jgi:hypothetical protein